MLLSAQQECTWFCSDLFQCGEAYKEYDANTQWLKKSKTDEYMTITLPSLARENNNSPPARTAAADAAIYCIYNAIKIRAYNKHFRVKYDIVVGLTGI